MDDDPLRAESDDVLARDGFARRVAEVVERVSMETPSAVLALIGPWGSGKTTLLHFVRRRIETRPRWHVAAFNPWFASDISSSVEEFFNCLLSAMPDKGKGKKLRKKVARYAEQIAPFLSPLNVPGFSPERALQLGSDLLAGDQSIENRLKELSSELEELASPTLILVDDVDRLQADEILVVFKLIRLVGRLPNVYYLLAFDEETILSSLSTSSLVDKDTSRALAYLEKIVQVRLDVPPVHPILAARLLDGLLTSLIESHQVYLDAKARYRLSSAYEMCMARNLREPRQIKRYIAQLDALYPLVSEEVDFVDFALIVYIRTFSPPLISALLSNKEELTGTALLFGKKPSHEEGRRAWLSKLERATTDDEEAESLLTLLGQLFVPIRSLVERTTYGADAYSELHLHRRVGSSEYFDRYFYLGSATG